MFVCLAFGWILQLARAGKFTKAALRPAKIHIPRLCWHRQVPKALLRDHDRCKSFLKSGNYRTCVVGNGYKCMTWPWHDLLFDRSWGPLQSYFMKRGTLHVLKGYSVPTADTRPQAWLFQAIACSSMHMFTSEFKYNFCWHGRRLQWKSMKVKSPDCRWATRFVFDMPSHPDSWRRVMLAWWSHSCIQGVTGSEQTQTMANGCATPGGADCWFKMF